MIAEDRPPWLARFLAPRHVADAYAIIHWQGGQRADTPAADAWCRLFFALEDESAPRRIHWAAFSAFGPPVTLACADWACEWLADRTIETARGLSARDFEKALALTPGERYAGLLVIDALAKALVNLGS